MITRQMLEVKNLSILDELLRMDPSLANAPIPYDDANKQTAHPLHRICDNVFMGAISDQEAKQLAQLFIQHGAALNGNVTKEKEDTPLVAACSLRADGVASLLIDKGAKIHHKGCMGGTALHWACWTGREEVVRLLLSKSPNLNQRCIDHQATPLFWAIHGHINIRRDHLAKQIPCARLLLLAGADPRIPNVNGLTIFDIMDPQDAALSSFVDDFDLDANSLKNA